MGREVLKLPRAYIANVIYTLVGQPFADWVNSGIESRNQKLTQKNDMLVQMDPEIARIFASSTTVSGKLRTLHILIFTLVQ